ncbi:MAG: STAS domain-containing protein [Roseiflexaceae bacterium]|nr:STAS domain-containing protein [Roseiflexaceae bacterium]
MSTRRTHNSNDAIRFNNLDLNRRVQTTTRLAAVLFVVALLFVPITFTIPRPMAPLLVLAGGLLCIGATFMLARRGLPTVAAWLLVGTFTIATLGSLAVTAPSLAISSGFYLSMAVVIAGLTMRPLQVWLVTGINLVGFAFTIWLFHADALSNPTRALPIYSSSGMLVMVGGIAFIGAQVFQRVLNEVVAARTEADQARSALQSANNNLEQQVAAQTAELRANLAAQQLLAGELRESLVTQQLLNQTINDLALPLIPVRDDTLIVPMTGAIDSNRASSLTTSVLSWIEERHTRTVILDITGVPVVDTQVAKTLLQIADATRLMGAETVLVGMRPEVAQSLIGLGVELKGLRTAASLQAGLLLTKQGAG